MVVSMNPYLNTNEIKEAFRKIYLEENYDFLEEDLIKPALLGMTWAESTVDSWIAEYEDGDGDDYTDSIFENVIRTGKLP